MSTQSGPTRLGAGADRLEVATEPPSATTAGPVGGPSSIGEALSAVGHDLSELMRQEVELAKAEAKDSAMKAARSAAAAAGAVVAALFALAFLSTAAWMLLNRWLDADLASLIVALVWVAIAAVLGVVGRSQLKKVQGMNETTETVREIPRALKGEEG